MDLLKEQNPQNYKLETRGYSTSDELYAAITKEGSLGLLALGHHGLLMWRKKRAELETVGKNKDEPSHE